ncbi:hypothetical protein ACFPK1_26915 [Actinomycetospora rhizophila]|uniref:Secreted protein n=1 Tax=Actinomycetospora rhizophila TaxID=1416876 RepID=A0ABV9ZKA2_9PSEU
MGQHSARRSGGAMSSVAGRGLFTATAAVALLGGGTSMAFAGEASSSGHEHAHGQEHSPSGSSGEGGSCDIPVVDDTTKTGEATVNAVTGDATAPLFEAGGQATQPVHDAVCPPASELLGPIVGEAPATSDEETGSEEATSEDEGSDESEASAESSGSAGSTPSAEGATEGSTEGSGVPMEIPIR